MTARRAHAWGAAIVVAGGLLGVTAALWAGRPGVLWRPLAIGLTAYVASAALVLRWGLEVYGPAGALGALALTAFTPGALAALGAPALLAPAGGTTLAGGLAQLAAAYALMRCLLDPSLQWALAAGIAIFAVPIGAFLHGSPAAAMAGIATFSALLIACRIATAVRCESRARLGRACVVSVVLAWAVAGGLGLLLAVASHLPAVEDYSHAPRRGVEPAVLRSPHPVPLPAGEGTFQVGFAPSFEGSLSRRERDRVRGFDDPPIQLVATVEGAAPAPASWPAVLPIASLVLVALRPWRRERRYTDAGWVAAVWCLGVPLWLAWGEPGGVFMAPFAALLAGGCWDGSRPLWIRRAVVVIVGLQVVAALLLWPRYPGGVRADAWLPMPGISLGAPSGSAASRAREMRRFPSATSPLLRTRSKSSEHEP